MFTEPWVFCPFCMGEIVEDHDPEWNTVRHQKYEEIQVAQLRGTCQNCNRDWSVILGQPDDFSSSHHAEILSIELGK